MAKLGDPGTLTWVLSAAAVAGFLAYRLLVPMLSVEPAMPSSSEESAGAAAPAALPDQLPDIELDLLGGERATLLNWVGQPLVINFWATWCAPCLREIPLLTEFQASQANDGAQIIGIAVDRADAVAKFVTTQDLNYPVLVGQSDAMELAGGFGTDFFALPFTVFADAAGRVLAVHTGEIHQGDLDNFAAVMADLNAGAASLTQARERLAGKL
jgi:thiol-disulfide isomerase/thioredoxin